MEDTQRQSVQEVLEKNRQEKKKKKKILLLLLILLLILLAGGCAAGYLLKKPSKWEQDRNAIAGFLPGRTQEEIENMLSQMVDESYMNVSINPNPVIQDGHMSLIIENISGNHYSQKVQVYIYPEKGNTERRELLYESGVIQPGYYIEEVEVSTDLPVGEYDAIAVVHGLDIDTQEEIGTTSMTMIITIVGEN